MLRGTYYVLATILLLGVCHQTSIYHPAIDNHSAVVVADGPAPPPPLPLAVPATETQLADGPAPPPPLPLAIPMAEMQLADGPAPPPPLPPLALPAFPVSPVQV